MVPSGWRAPCLQRSGCRPGGTEQVHIPSPCGGSVPGTALGATARKKLPQQRQANPYLLEPSEAVMGFKHAHTRAMYYGHVRIYYVPA